MASRSTRLVVQNRLYSNVSVTIRAEVASSENWDSQDRPDVNFDNVVIVSGEERSQHEELNESCNSAWFTLHVVTSDGQSFSFKNEHWDALSNDTIQRDQYEISRGVGAGTILVSQTAGQGVNTFVIKGS